MFQGVSPAQRGTEIAPGDRNAGNAAEAREAAQQFEALLLGQILRSVRASGGDSAGECATDFAEEELALVMARRGGLGLARLIEAGLKASSPPQMDADKA